LRPHWMPCCFGATREQPLQKLDLKALNQPFEISTASQNLTL
jgi:hypothetical protein